MTKKKIFIGIIIVFLALIITIFDFVIGVFYNKLSPEYGRVNLENALSIANNTLLEESHFSHPYLTYVNTPNYMFKKIKQHNNLGYRNSVDLNLKNTNSNYRILCIGGSTTYGQGVISPEDAWPEILQKKLNSNALDKKFTVINGGLRYATSAELLNHYIFRDRYLCPDLVIIHCGGNDTGPLKSNNYSAEYTHWRQLRSTGSELRPGEAFIINKSNIIKLLYSIIYSRLNPVKNGAFVSTIDPKTVNPKVAMENVLKNNPVGYQRNLELLMKNIKADSSKILFFNFFAPDSSFLEIGNQEAVQKANKTTNFLEMIKVNSIALSKNKKAAVEVCKKINVSFFEMINEPKYNNFFVDQCHLNIEGQKTKANFLLPKILKLINEDKCS